MLGGERYGKKTQNTDRWANKGGWLFIAIYGTIYTEEQYPAKFMHEEIRVKMILTWTSDHKTTWIADLLPGRLTLPTGEKNYVEGRDRIEEEGSAGFKSSPKGRLSTVWAQRGISKKRGILSLVQA